MSSNVLNKNRKVMERLQSNRLFNPWKLSKMIETSVTSTANSIVEWDGEPSKYDSWRSGIEQVSFMLNVKQFITGKEFIPEIESDNEDEEVTEPGFIFQAEEKNDDDDEDAVYDEQHSVSSSKKYDGEIPRSKISIDFYISLQENLNVIFATIWRTIHNSPTLMTIANKENAMDDKNPIMAFTNIKNEFVEVTGITI
jgi:hypothetical protein